MLRALGVMKPLCASPAGRQAASKAVPWPCLLRAIAPGCAAFRFSEVVDTVVGVIADVYGRLARGWGGSRRRRRSRRASDAEHAHALGTLKAVAALLKLLPPPPPPLLKLLPSPSLARTAPAETARLSTAPRARLVACALARLCENDAELAVAEAAQIAPRLAALVRFQPNAAWALYNIARNINVRSALV